MNLASNQNRINSLLTICIVVGDNVTSIGGNAQASGITTTASRGDKKRFSRVLRFVSEGGKATYLDRFGVTFAVVVSKIVDSIGFGV